MFDFGELKSIVKDLDDSTTALSQFALLVSSNRHTSMQRPSRPSRKARALAKILLQAHKTASELYFAILQGWRGDCHDTHEAKLFLEDRVFVTKQPQCSPVFKFIFGAESLGGRKEWHEAAVQALVDEEEEEGGEGQLDRGISTRNSYTAHSVTINITSVSLIRPNISLVDNICTAIQPVQNTSQQMAFVLTRPQRIGTKAADDCMINPCACFETTSLRAFLFDRQNQPRHAVTSVKPRMQLALRLASSLLQLCRTQWLPNTWSHDKVYFKIKPTPIFQGQGHEIDLGRPFISTAFGRDATPVPLVEANPKAVLLDLGILLLEIWHEQTLDAHFPGKATPNTTSV